MVNKITLLDDEKSQFGDLRNVELKEKNTILVETFFELSDTCRTSVIGVSDTNAYWTL